MKTEKERLENFRYMAEDDLLNERGLMHFEQLKHKLTLPVCVVCNKYMDKKRHYSITPVHTKCRQNVSEPLWHFLKIIHRMYDEESVKHSEFGERYKRLELQKAIHYIIQGMKP